MITTGQALGAVPIAALLTAILGAAGTSRAQTPANDNAIGEDDAMVTKAFVIVKATTSYDEARALAKAAATRLDVPIDLRALAPDDTIGLTFPKDQCRDEFGEFPCYVPRGRWDDGVYLSIEHSSAYLGWREGRYIVVLASGSPHDHDLLAALHRAKTVYPDATLKTTPIYLGCIH